MIAPGLRGNGLFVFRGTGFQPVIVFAIRGSRYRQEPKMRNSRMNFELQTNHRLEACATEKG
jgi:hypothetical protein